MSLIQEALRRQQQEMDVNSDAPKVPDKPSTPAPSPQEAPRIARKTPIVSTPADMDSSAPPPVQQPPELADDAPPPPPQEALENDGDTEGVPPAGKKSKPGMKVALLIVGAMVCLGLGVWAISFAIQNFRAESHSEGPDSPPETAPATPSTPPAQQKPDPVKPADPTVTKPAEPIVKQPPEPEPVVVKEPVFWPLLRITGFLRNKGKGAVMFETEIVDVGNSIEGVKVISISKQGALLEYQGERKMVRVGQSTE